MVRVNGISPPMAISSFNNTIDTLERAVKERVFYVKNKLNQFVAPPKPKAGHFFGALRGTKELLGLYLPSTAPLTRQGFVETFRGRKRLIYQAAADDLLRRGFSLLDSALKVFVKYEKTDFTRKSDPVPRVISPRSPRYNVELGRFLRPLEEKIYNSLAKLFGHPTVIKGLNSADSGRVLYEKWNSFTSPVAIGLDASRFDQHVSVDALRWEHSVYIDCFRRSKHRQRLRYLLDMQLKNQCRGYAVDGKLKYHVEGGRMSGDMNTGLGNCLLMCSMIHAYAQHVKVRVHLANNGDDCVVFMEKVDLDRFSLGLHDWFLAMGFSMVVEVPSYTFEEIEFCQTHPVFVGPNSSDYLMVRHPRWGIAKDTSCVHAYQTVPLYKGWLDAVGKGGISLTGGIPVFQDFYSTYIRYGCYHKSVQFSQESWNVRQLAKGMTRGYGVVLDATRASFYWAFGVTPDEQLVMEEFYRGVKLGFDLDDNMSYQVPMPI